MASRILTHLQRRVDWPRVIPTAAPFAAYGVIMALVALFAEG